MPTFSQRDKRKFWGDVYGRAKLGLEVVLEADSERQRARYAVREAYQRRPYRNGYYERDFVNPLGYDPVAHCEHRQEYKAFVRRARRFRVGIG